MPQFVLATVLGFAMAALGAGAALGMWYAYRKKGGSGPSRRLLNLGHRITGYAFAAVYVAAMAMMLPRVIDSVGSFSVALIGHIVAAVLVGVVLVVKVLVLRTAPKKRRLLPWLGGALAVLALAVMYQPIALALTMKRDTAAASTPENKARAVAALSQVEGFEGHDVAAIVEYAASDRGIVAFRSDCGQCHTVELTLRKHKTAGKWWETVEEMAEKAEEDDDARKIDEESARLIAAWLVLVRPKG
jgi:mono/diheme cytochrome c family protein